MYSQAFKTWSRFLAVILLIGMTFTNFSGSNGFLSSKAYAGNGQQQTQSETPAASPSIEPSTTPTDTPNATDTPNPTDTPKPSETPKPTGTPTASVPPAPTASPTPSPSITPSPTASPNNETDKSLCISYDELAKLKTLPCDEDKYTTITGNSDGTKTAKIYSDPVRYKDEQGKWKNIDNSIVQTDKTKNPDYQYKNKSSDVDVLFSDNLGKSNAIEVNYKDYSVGFKPLDIEKENGKSSAALSFARADKTKAQDNKFDKTKKYNSIEYSKTFNENADIQLTPNANGMKEDIILNQIPSETEFSYELNMKNVVPRLDESGNLYFIDQKNSLLVASIASPSMCDSSKEQQFTYDIQVKLEKINDTTFKYTLTPNRAFLENKKTVYPVKIDPTLNIDQNYISDTFVSSRYPNNNYSSDYSIKVGYSSDLYVTRGLIKINSFPSQLTGAKIIKATYSAYQDYAGTDSETVEIRKLLSNWNDSTVNYSNQPDYSTYIERSVTVTTAQRYTWNITYLVQNWFQVQLLITA